QETGSIGRGRISPQGGAGRPPTSARRRATQHPGLPARIGDGTSPTEEVRRSRAAVAGSLCRSEETRKHNARGQGPPGRGNATTRAALGRLGQERQRQGLAKEA